MTPWLLPSPPAMHLDFPVDPAVIDVRKEFGAKGNGITDDTEAIQKALDASCGVGGRPTRVLFLHKGVYRLTKSLVVRSPIGPWLYGESRDSVILKLDDGVKGVTSVLRTHPNDSGPSGIYGAMRNIYNLTIDVGKNPQTDGIRWFATNTGILKSVRVKGIAKIGINAGFLEQSGPNLIQNTIVSQFETGIVAQWNQGGTLSNILITDCRKTGVSVSASVLGIHGLTVRGTPQALHVTQPNGKADWSGVVALISGIFSNGDPAKTAIENQGVLYARGVSTIRIIYRAKPYQQIIPAAVDTYAELARGSSTTLQEYQAPVGKSLGQRATRFLPIEDEPDTPWTEPSGTWVCVNDFGAIRGDDEDDTPAFEKAIAEAKKRGATTLSLRGVDSDDSQGYILSKPLTVPAPIRRVIGLGFGRVAARGTGGFVVNDTSAPTVQFLNIDAFDGTPPQLVNRSQKNALLAESCGVRIVGEGLGPIFVTNCAASVDLRTPGQSLWARQLSLQGDSDDALVKNNGGKLWAVGVRSEGKGTSFATKNGARTELYGVSVQGSHYSEADKRPMFLVEGASMSVFALREVSRTNFSFPIKVKTAERTIISKDENGPITWSRYDISSR